MGPTTVNWVDAVVDMEPSVAVRVNWSVLVPLFNNTLQPVKVTYPLISLPEQLCISPVVEEVTSMITGDKSVVTKRPRLSSTATIG